MLDHTTFCCPNKTAFYGLTLFKETGIQGINVMSMKQTDLWWKVMIKWCKDQKIEPHARSLSCIRPGVVRYATTNSFIF